MRAVGYGFKTYNLSPKGECIFHNADSDNQYSPWSNEGHIWKNVCGSKVVWGFANSTVSGSSYLSQRSDMSSPAHQSLRTGYALNHSLLHAKVESRHTHMIPPTTLGGREMCYPSAMLAQSGKIVCCLNSALTTWTSEALLLIISRRWGRLKEEVGTRVHGHFGRYEDERLHGHPAKADDADCEPPDHRLPSWQDC